MAGYGGETPLIGFGLRLTVEAPDGTTSASPVEQGDLFKIDPTAAGSAGVAADGTGYKAVAMAEGDDATSDVVVMAVHRITEVQPLGVIVLGPYQQVRRISYVTGAAPTLGQSIEAGSNPRKVKGKSFDGNGMVLKVDTATEQVEVLV